MVSVETGTTSMATSTVTGTKKSILGFTFSVLTIVFVLVAVAICFVAGVPWWVGIFIGAVLAAVATVALSRNVTQPLLSAVGAVDATPESSGKRISNLVEGLSLTGGIQQPQVYLIHDGAMNAAALAEGESGTILVTSGLLEKLSRVELEGVVAELVARIKSGDAEVATLSSAIFGRLITGPLSPLTRSFGVNLLNRQYVADRDIILDGSAVLLTRYPPGLRGALTKIDGSSSAIAGTLPIYDGVWLVPSGEESELPVYVGASDLDLRIAVLSEL